MVYDHQFENKTSWNGWYITNKQVQTCEYSNIIILSETYLQTWRLALVL